jgi:hypothetical protein
LKTIPGQACSRKDAEHKSGGPRYLLSGKPLLKRIDEYNYMKYAVPAMKEKKARGKAE